MAIGPGVDPKRLLPDEAAGIRKELRVEAADTKCGGSRFKVPG